jgi:Ca2+-binding RTX toxin-like protein
MAQRLRLSWLYRSNYLPNKGYKCITIIQSLRITHMDSTLLANRLLTATIDNDSLRADRGSLFGLEGNNTLRGASRQANVLFGNEGNDRLYGSRQDDVLNGGSGNDRLFSDRGNDLLVGGSGDDYLSGDEGNDRFKGGAGSDRLFGDKGNDYLDGGAEIDCLDGGKKVRCTIVG